MPVLVIPCTEKYFDIYGIGVEKRRMNSIIPFLVDSEVDYGCMECTHYVTLFYQDAVSRDK